MSTIKQFWSLMKFQIRANPGIYSLPFIGIIILTSPHLAGLQDSFEHSLFLQVSQTLWIMAAFMLAPQFLAPELSLIRIGQVTRENGTEFLLTRAADRYLLLRVRSVLYFGLILALPCCVLFWSLQNPRLDLKESDAKIYHMVLHQVPGSTQVQSMSGVDVSGHRITPSDRNELISIPHGKLIIASWRIWLLTCTITSTQVFIFFICQFRFQKMLFYAVGIGLLSLPLLLTIVTDKMNFEFHSMSWNQIFFIYFSAHQLLCWLIAITALILGQLWCESRFSRMEQ